MVIGLLCVACGDSPAFSVGETEPESEVETARFDGIAEIPTLSRIAVFAADGCRDDGFGEIIEEAGESFSPDGDVEATALPCGLLAHRGVAGEGMVLKATLEVVGGYTDVRLLRFDAHAANGTWGFPTVRIIAEDHVAVMNWTAPQTGEYALVVDTPEHAESADYTLSVRCVENCDTAMTRFPIVLLHGMGGTDAYIDLLEYYFGVEGAMEEAGFNVFVTVVDPLQSATVRATQLVPQLEDIMDISGARRLNLIGHSQGGLDGRVLISGLGWGDRIASYTTIASPHLGTPVADLAAGITTDSDITQALLDSIGDLFGRLLGRGDQAINDSILEMTSEYMIEIFNPTYPNDPQVEYFSWNGHTCSRLELDCRRDWNDEVVDLLLAPTYRALQIMGYDDNDGLVPLESSKLGTFLGEIPADHLDEVGQLADTRNRSFDHRAFFVSEGHRLFEAGF